MGTDTGFKLRTAAPSGDWRSFPVTAGSGGVTAGCLTKIHDSVGVYMQDGDIGDVVAFCYHAEKIELPKVAGSTLYGAYAGDKAYYSAANHAITPVAGSNLWVGIFVKDCLTTAAVCLIDLKGDKAHS